MAGASSAGTVTCASSLLKEVYNPKAVIPHAASLRQASAHCAIFPTAASRRSLGRISVPVWPVALSGRLPVEALVSHYLTNKLIGREPIPNRRSFPLPPMQAEVISSIRRPFERLFQSQGQVAHVLLTRSPLVYPRRGLTVRLACVKHAASVRPEPGSNSPLKTLASHTTPTPKQKPRNQQKTTEQDSQQNPKQKSRVTKKHHSKKSTPTTTNQCKTPASHHEHEKSQTKIGIDYLDTLLSSQASFTHHTKPTRKQTQHGANFFARSFSLPATFHYFISPFPRCQTRGFCVLCTYFSVHRTPKHRRSISYSLTLPKQCHLTTNPADQVASS